MGEESQLYYASTRRISLKGCTILASSGEWRGAELESRVRKVQEKQGLRCVSFSRKGFRNLYNIMILTTLLNMTKDLAALFLLQILFFVP
jgi:hypothetical protein